MNATIREIKSDAILLAEADKKSHEMQPFFGEGNRMHLLNFYLCNDMFLALADGMITVNDEPENLRKLIDAFRKGGGEGKALSLQAHVAYAPSEQEALDAAYDQWRTNIFESNLLSDIKNVAQFDVLGNQVRREDVCQAVRVSSDLVQHRAWLYQYLELGFDHVYLHEVGPDQERFVDVFAEHVLPALKQ
ncbi:hypothetical protein [Deinococcus peraridilitoris]|uniref:hypothetical protein n=1 Tax=Deinococcus peraridilitoris TaxID=432329 RepID=UPI0012FBB52B|nr:hypothetical protein [Deinococcus peraridilitoris]